LKVPSEDVEANQTDNGSLGLDSVLCIRVEVSHQQEILKIIGVAATKKY